VEPSVAGGMVGVDVTAVPGESEASIDSASVVAAVGLLVSMSISGSAEVSNICASIGDVGSVSGSLVKA
jgi:hypothetical protein